jgi:hypothetical protein
MGLKRRTYMSLRPLKMVRSECECEREGDVSRA